MNEVLYISQSPLQLLNNIEAYLKLENKRGKHLIFVRDAQSMEAIDSITRLFKLGNYKKYRISKLFRLLFPFVLGAEARTRYHKIYFGNTTSYTSFLINTINPGELVHVDDGSRTISLLQLDKNSEFYRSPALWFLDKRYLNRSTFFTYYSQEAQEAQRIFIKNTLSEVRRHISHLEHLDTLAPADRNQKIFIGTNILRSYRDIEQVFDLTNTRIGLKDCIYLMHRYDDVSLMKFFAAKHGFKALKVNLPIELYFGYLWQKNHPSVWTFGSTAIDTLALVSPETEFNIIALNKGGFIKPGLGDAFHSLYEHFKHHPRVTLHELDR